MGSSPSTVRRFLIFIVFLFIYYQGKRPRLDQEDLESDDGIDIVIEELGPGSKESADPKAHIADISRKVRLRFL